MSQGQLTTQPSAILLLFKHWRHLLQTTKADLRSRYAGSLLGMGWIAIYPLIFLSIYAVVYSVVFGVRVDGLTQFQYVLYIFAGLIPILCTSETLTMGITSVVSNKAVLHNTVFPIDLVPPKAVLVSQGTMAVGFPLLVLGTVFTGNFSWTTLLLPVIWGFQLLMMCGLVWIFSMLNVVLRDLQIMVGLIMLMILIASPIAYTPSMVPEKMKLLIYLNPFAYFVTSYQHILILGQLPPWKICAVMAALSLTLFTFGAWFFQRSKRVLVDYV